MNLITTFLVCLYFPVPFIMLWLHLLQPVWRPLGKHSYWIHTPVYLAMVATCALLHRRWSTGVLIDAGAADVVGFGLIGISVAILIISYRFIDPWTLMAGPQLTRSRRKLITDGIYAYIRHPRYLILITGALGNFLLTGTVSLLIAFIVTTTLTIMLTHVEEAELRRQFGSAYEDYAHRVPAFIPRRRNL